MGVMKKVSIIVLHSDIVSLINELIYLECFEPMIPEVTLNPPELNELVKQEVMELEYYEANLESITVLATDYTYTLIGWVPAELELVLTSSLSEITCVCNIEDVPDDEADNVPIYIKHPQLFGKLRSGGRTVFEPLVQRSQNN